jgi:hypothetical protein
MSKNRVLAVLTSFSISLVTSFTFVTTESPQKAYATATFNANTLVSDGVFVNKDAMSVAQIQSFLVAKNSILATTPSSMLGPNANGRNAAQIIWDAGRASISDYGSASRPSNPFTVSLSPQVILATLQKEQSLVTGSFTMGSGAHQTALNGAMGMDCPDQGGCSNMNSAFAGFANQVTYGAAALWLQYWRAYSPANYSNTNPPRRIGDTINFNAVLPSVCNDPRFSNVTISNGATASLYRYTTGCNGNYNFWLFMTTWFSLFNDNRPVRVVQGSGPDVFVYYTNPSRKFYVDSFAALQHWRVFEPIERVDDVELASVPTQGAICRMCIASGDTAVYLITDGKRHHIKSDVVFPAYGLSWAQLRTTTPEMINGLPEGSPIGYLARTEGDPDVYLATNVRKFYFKDAASVFNWGYTFNDIKALQPQHLASLPTEPEPVQYYMRIMNAPDMFLVSAGRRYYVPNMNIARAWGLEPGLASRVGIEMAPLLPQIGNLTRVARVNGQVFYMENGRKRLVTNVSRLSRVGESTRSIIDVSPFVMDQIPRGADL